MPQDHFDEIDAAAVVAVRRRAAHTPQRRRQELAADRSVVFALVERASEIVALKVRVDVTGNEGTVPRLLQSRQSRDVAP